MEDSSDEKSHQVPPASAPATPSGRHLSHLQSAPEFRLEVPTEEPRTRDEWMARARSISKAAGMLAPVPKRRALSEDLAERSRLRHQHLTLPTLPFRADFAPARSQSTVSIPSDVQLQVGEEETVHAMWHTTPVDKVALRMATSSSKGLTEKQAEERLRNVGLNQLQAKAGVHPVRIFLQNLFSFLLILLMVAMILSFATGENLEGGVLAVIIAFNAVLGFIQEYKSEKTLEALKSMSTGVATVYRDGKLQQLPSVQLVPGDLIKLETGGLVPADIRLVDAKKLEVNESSLTGESVPARKAATTLTEANVPLGDRVNMAYSGCVVVRGTGTGIVIGTGMQTQLGRIAHHVSNSSGQQPTYLDREIRMLGISLFSLGLIFAVVVFAANRFVWSNATLLYAVTLVVAVIPESLPVMLTVTLALGMRRMARRNAVVRKITALESLGRVTDICSDKTGTLTQAKMQVMHMWLPHASYHITGAADAPIGEFIVSGQSVQPDAAAKLLLRNCVICNDSTLHEEEGKWKSFGNPTEVALAMLGAKAKIFRSDLEKQEKIVASLPFESVVKSMTVVTRKMPRGEYTAYMKGAPENVLRCCTRVQYADHEIMLPEDLAPIIAQVMRAMTTRGWRVLGIAYRPKFNFRQGMGRQEIDKDMVFLGLVAIYDPPRPESEIAVAQAHAAGIEVHMLTGDHPTTASAIAVDIGIIPEDDPQGDETVMTAQQFEAMQYEQVDQLVQLPLVIARCAPDTKVRMVKALHRRKRIVAMTGDGVNDAPSIKAADVGIAMGVMGTEVTKQAADIVLLDDNFATIVAAVEEGRAMFDNIKKFIVHEITSNIASLLLLVIGLVFRDAQNQSVYPLSVLQTLWINTFIVAMPSLGLSFEKRDPELMRRAPDLKNRGVFSREVRADILIYGIMIGGFTLASFSIVLYGVYGGAIGDHCNEGGVGCMFVERARSTAFATLALLLLVNATDCRHSTEYVWERSLLANKRLLLAVLACASTVVMAIYIPFVNSVIFRQAPISWEWALPAASCVIYELLVQVYKAMKKTCLRKALDMAPPIVTPEYSSSDSEEFGSVPELPVATSVLEGAPPAPQRDDSAIVDDQDVMIEGDPSVRTRSTTI